MEQQENKTVAITEEQLAEYQRLKEQEQAREEEQRAKNEREDFRRLSEQAVSETFGELKAANEALKRAKMRVLSTFSSLLELKISLIGGKEQGQHTFRDEEREHRITIGKYKKVSYDATADAGISLIEESLASMADGEKSQKLVRIILDLLSRDGRGQLQAENVIQLDKYVEMVADSRFARGVTIIKEAFLAEWTRVFIRAEEKDEKGKWVNIPLSMVEV